LPAQPRQRAPLKDSREPALNRPKESGCLTVKLLSNVETSKPAPEEAQDVNETKQNSATPKLATKVFRMSFDWSKVKLKKPTSDGA